MEIKNDTIYQIKTKVVLYKNKKYFPIFRNIFITNTLNYLLSKNKTQITSNPKIQNIQAQNNETYSLWNIIAKNIQKDTEIIDYDLNSYKRQQNDENEENDDDDNFFQFLINQTKLIEINNLVFSYLNKICTMKLNKLISISHKSKIPLINLMKIYLGFCSQSFTNNKNKHKNNENNENKEDRNSPASLSKQITKKFTIENIINPNEDNNINKTTKKIIKLKSNDIYKRTITIEQSKSKIEEENNKEKNDANSAYDIMINEQILKSLNKLNSKNKNSNNKILYSSSIARLFIGETDKESIREKYLSNFEIKKEKKLKKNKDKNLSSIFYKVFLTRLEQNKKNKHIMERGIESIVKKFQKNQEIIDKYIRLKDRSMNRFNVFDGYKKYNKTTPNKKVKINYYKNNSLFNKSHKVTNYNMTKRLNKIQFPNKLTKHMLNNYKVSDNTVSDKTTKYSSLNHNKIKYNFLNEKKDKVRFIYDYNYNLKNYLNMNQNNLKKLNENEKMKTKNNTINIKKRIIKRPNEDDNNYNVFLKGNLTARVRRNDDDSFYKYKMLRQKNKEFNTNAVNYITKDDLFFDNL